MTEPDAGNAGPSLPPPHRDGGGEQSTTWAGWEADLARAVTTLADGEALTITSGPDHARPVLLRKGLLRGFVPAKHEHVEPWVRLARLEDHVRGNCVGSEGIGGSFPFSPEEDEALVEIGWHRPGAGDGTDYLRFWPDDVAQGPFLPLEEAQRVARDGRPDLPRGLRRVTILRPTPDPARPAPAKRMPEQAPRPLPCRR